jgi:hypothetical protein
MRTVFEFLPRVLFDGFVAARLLFLSLHQPASSFTVYYVHLSYALGEAERQA